MIVFLQKRVHLSTLPSPMEIQLLEVFKKLTESGWIVRKAEFR